jgi:hypothetical protein
VLGHHRIAEALLNPGHKLRIKRSAMFCVITIYRPRPSRSAEILLVGPGPSHIRQCARVRHGYHFIRLGDIDGVATELAEPLGDDLEVMVDAQMPLNVAATRPTKPSPRGHRC